MKNIMLAILALSSFTLYADEGKAKKIPVKEIKAYVETINPEATCLDEYLKRRQQLIVKLSASPVIMVAGTAASVYGGALAGVGVAAIVKPGGWGDLAYLATGAVFGGGAGALGTVADTAVTAVQLRNTNLIIQALASQQMQRESAKVEKLYAKYLKRSEKDLPKEEFLNKLGELDASGALCNGSLVKQPKIKIGSKLKFKVAKIKGLVNGVDSL